MRSTSLKQLFQKRGMFILHGYPLSACTSRVVATFVQLGLKEGKDYKVEAVPYSAVKTPEWQLHQPFAQMPWMEDTEAGIELYESRAISRYVATKLKSPLAPTLAHSAARYAAFERAAYSESQQIDSQAVSILVELLFGPKMCGKTPDMAKVAQHSAALLDKFKAYDRILAQSAFIAGDELTIADLWHAPTLTLLGKIGKDTRLTDGSLPNLTR